MVDEHPPFGPPAQPPGAGASPEWSPPDSQPPGVRRGWTAGRITIIVIGSLLALISLCFLAIGGAATWFLTQRDGGYVSAGSRDLSTPGYALATPPMKLGHAWRAVLGAVRVRVTDETRTTPIFVGIGYGNEVATYLGGVQYTTVNNMLYLDRGSNVAHAGNPPAAPPGTKNIWISQATGTGTQTVVWRGQLGVWSVVAMNANGSPGLRVHAAVGVAVPALPWMALGFLVGGALVLLISVTLIVVPVRRATRA